MKYDSIWLLSQSLYLLFEMWKLKILISTYGILLYSVLCIRTTSPLPNLSKAVFFDLLKAASSLKTKPGYRVLSSFLSL